jgi:hypothetical protein
MIQSHVLRFVALLFVVAAAPLQYYQGDQNGTVSMTLELLRRNQKEEPKKATDMLAREIVLTDKGTIGEQLSQNVDFAKERLLIFSWVGGGDGKLSFEVQKTKEGSLIVFNLIGGFQKNKVSRMRYYAIQRNVRWQTLEKNRTPEPKVISTAEELNRIYFPDKK